MEKIIKKIALFLNIYNELKLYKNIIRQNYRKYFKNSNKFKEKYIKKDLKKV